MLVVAIGFTAAKAAEPQHCVEVELVLWGDGRHDDTAALNGWFEGRPAVWADTGAPVGDTVAGRSFRLLGALYVAGGSGRDLEDFRLLWPERGETVSGGSIRSGTDPDQAPLVAGVNIVGGDSGEGVPFETPDPLSTGQNAAASCATS